MPVLKYNAETMGEESSGDQKVPTRKYLCKICGLPKKGHTCLGYMPTENEDKNDHEEAGNDSQKKSRATVGGKSLKLMRTTEENKPEYESSDDESSSEEDSDMDDAVDSKLESVGSSKSKNKIKDGEKTMKRKREVYESEDLEEDDVNLKRLQSVGPAKSKKKIKDDEKIMKRKREEYESEDSEEDDVNPKKMESVGSSKSKNKIKDDEKTMKGKREANQSEDSEEDDAISRKLESAGQVKTKNKEKKNAKKIKRQQEESDVDSSLPSEDESNSDENEKSEDDDELSDSDDEDFTIDAVKTSKKNNQGGPLHHKKAKRVRKNQAIFKRGVKKESKQPIKRDENESRGEGGCLEKKKSKIGILAQQDHLGHGKDCQKQKQEKAKVTFVDAKEKSEKETKTSKLREAEVHDTDSSSDDDSKENGSAEMEKVNESTCKDQEMKEVLDDLVTKIEDGQTQSDQAPACQTTTSANIQKENDLSEEETLVFKEENGQESQVSDQVLDDTNCADTYSREWLMTEIINAGVQTKDQLTQKDTTTLMQDYFVVKCPSLTSTPQKDADEKEFIERKLLENGTFTSKDMQQDITVLRDLYIKSLV